ncbi:hypothetical protein Lste_1731 [Legionella steelei]|uniref:Uncharacterized protein n=1 Tax=Legionella steelei TaxID=947033 RepID=A0A0W0ZH78_9GAMM|nr:hypothetical protein [Legionella steelei]KTD68573.1 hypothetical protein Lste_1731 [Legionella steelei]
MGGKTSFHSGFLTTPFAQYQGDKSPELSKDDLDWLIGKLYHFVMNTPKASDLLQSNFSYWLTYALQSAVSLYDEGAVQQICSLFYQLNSAENPDILISIFAQSLGGKFAGQTVAYAWMDSLFSATYDPRNTSAVVAIHYIFSQLLEQKGDALSNVVTKNMEEGSEKGKNAILVLTRALANATTPTTQSTAELLAKLLMGFVKKSPAILGTSLTQEIRHGSFQGKSGVYVLAGAINNAVDNNAKLIQLISDILIDLNKICSQDLIDALCKIHDQGPYKGKHVLHIILISLVSAAYSRRSSEAVKTLTHLVHHLWKKDTSEKVNLALMDTIHDGEHVNLNGIMMLVRAMVAAIDHQIPIAQISDFLVDLIQTGPKGLGDAFMHCAPESTIGDYTHSPLVLLISALQNTQDVVSKTNVHDVIIKLAGSKSAIEMLFSLSGDEKLFFIGELKKVHSLTDKQVTWLTETDSKTLKASSASLDSRFFLGKNSRCKGPHFFATFPPIPKADEQKNSYSKEDSYQRHDDREVSFGCCSL